MTSGRFDKTTGRIRPGTYVNMDSSDPKPKQYASRGSVLIPFVNTWGPTGTIVKVEASNPEEADAKLGGDASSMLLIKEALKGASTVLAYNINDGEKATATALESNALTITALYPGTRGNDIKVSCAENTSSKYDISVILGSDTVETFENIENFAGVIAIESEYVKFTGTSGTLAAFAAVSLAGGTTTAPTNDTISAMLDACENEAVSAVAFPFTDDSLKAVAASKAEYLRDTLGKSIQVVVANYATADYEGIINVTNSYALEDGTQLTTAQATAFVAAITASATELTSNTYKVVPEADTVIGKKSNEQAEAAITAGEFFFTQSGNEVIVEYDINSLHTFTETRSKVYSKNKIIRVHDAVADAIRETFPPNKYPNDSMGWDLMDGMAQVILKRFLDEGAITDVDLSNDMLVNRSQSSGDSVYFDVAIHAVDAAEKLYFTVTTD